MAGSFTYDVFLSHNSQDKPRVREIAERLRQAGLRVWFDEWLIRPGDDIYLAIERGLEEARVQVLCLSPAALASGWVNLERNTVLFRDPTNQGRRFVPLLLADCTLPDTLRRYKYLDFRQGSPSAFDELLAACREEAEDAALEAIGRNTEPVQETRRARPNECRGIELACVFCESTGRDPFSTTPCRICNGHGVMKLSSVDRKRCRYCNGTGRDPNEEVECAVCGGLGLVVRAAP